MGLSATVPAYAVTRRKPLDTLQTDVLVVGGGPAGIGAAVGAAKAGAKTLVLEDCGFFWRSRCLEPGHVHEPDAPVQRTTRLRA